jgi:hypothetical protein
MADPERRTAADPLIDRMPASLSRQSWHVADRSVDDAHNVALGRIGILNMAAQAESSSSRPMPCFTSRRHARNALLFSTTQAAG